MYQNPFVGRMNRSNFIYSQLLLVGFVIVISIFIFKDGITMNSVGKLLPIAVLTIPPQIILAIRRLHDINISGLWSFLIVTPYLSLLFVIFISVKQGSSTVNNYGNPDTRPFLDSLLNKDTRTN